MVAAASIVSTPAAISLTTQLVKQGFGLLQIQRVKARGEPAVDRGEKIVRLPRFALVAPEAGHTHRCAQFPGLSTASARSKIGLSLRVRRGRLQLDAAGNSVDPRLAGDNKGLRPFARSSNRSVRIEFVCQDWPEQNPALAVELHHLKLLVDAPIIRCG
jgi:hypothetical protein